MLGELEEVAKGGVAGVVTATGLLGAGGWSSAPGALGGFGGQGFLVLPPLPVPFPVPGDALLLLPCSLLSLPGSGKFFSIMSHMETLIVAPDGYSLGFSSSSIPSGRSPSPGLSRRVQTLQRLWRKRKANPSSPQPVFDCLQAVGAHVLAELEAPGHAALALGVAVAVVLVPHQPTQ